MLKCNDLEFVVSNLRPGHRYDSNAEMVLHLHREPAQSLLFHPLYSMWVVCTTSIPLEEMLQERGVPGAKSRRPYYPEGKKAALEDASLSPAEACFWFACLQPFLSFAEATPRAPRQIRFIGTRSNCGSQHQEPEACDLFA